MFTFQQFKLTLLIKFQKNSECQQTAYVWIKLSKKETILQEHDSFDFNIFLSGMLNQIFKYELSLYFVDKKEVILQMICKYQSYGIPITYNTITQSLSILHYNSSNIWKAYKAYGIEERAKHILWNFFLPIFKNCAIYNRWSILYKYHLLSGFQNFLWDKMDGHYNIETMY